MYLKLFISIVLTLLIHNNALAWDISFEERTIEIVGNDNIVNEFNVEVADNNEKRALGLMDRKKIAKNGGMIFLFDKPRKVNMWMKDTHIPLDMLFINADNAIIKIVEAKPMSLKTISSDKEIAAVVELNAGICKKLGIKEDDRVIF